MAEPDSTALDSRLRDALGRAAQPGDSTGVADAIRARVAAGDPGTSVATATAPGWGGSPWSWMPWLGLVVVAGIAGGAIGTTGILMPPTSQATVVAGFETGAEIDGAACPGGPPVGRVVTGSRVLAVARSDDGGWLGVRDPSDHTRTLWFDRDIVILDDGGTAIADLPVGACPEAVVMLGEPTPEPTAEPTEEPAPAPQPGDSSAPAIGQLSATNMNCQVTQVISVTATDDVAVTGVTLSWAGQYPGSAAMSGSGTTWSYTFTGPSSDIDQQYTLTAVARDAAGNTASSSAMITVYCIG